MKARQLLLTGIFCSCMVVCAVAQTILFSEDFNACVLPDGWQVTLDGHPTAAWYVGTPTNPSSDSVSIDGSCMFIVDDDASGENTPGFDLELRSPVFDASQFSSIYFDVDVHFRNYNGSDSLQLLVFDGQEYHLLQTFRGWQGHTGEQFSQYQRIQYDLTFFATATTQIVLRYADGGDWNWWAGIDNLVVMGEGTGLNVLLETFNDCTLPDGWFSSVLTGEDTWQFGTLNNPNTGITTMNGNCFLYFDDDGIGQEAPFSTALVATPEMDGTLGVNMLLTFDLTLRTYEQRESLTIAVFDAETEQLQIVTTYQQDIGGPEMNAPVRMEIDISAFRSKRMRVVFLYNDGQSWGWWVGIDNVRVSTSGQINEVCANALPLVINADDCIPANNALAVFDGVQPTCGIRHVGSLWYHFTPDQSGWLRITTDAAFNDVLTLFPGSCDNPQPIACYNRDEHGFEGEGYFVAVTAGQDYLLRISGNQGGFGISRGLLCLRATSPAVPPTVPANSACTDALPMVVDGDCVSGHNHWGLLPDPQPNDNVLARSGVWYTFTPASGEALAITTQANFADGIAVFTGGCNGLQEVAANAFGERVVLGSPVAGQPYYVLVTGTFATIEGDMCVAVARIPSTPPANDACQTAIPLALTGECLYVNNHAADFDGPTISCSPFLGASVWFRFMAPPSGSVQLLSDADFAQAVSVYSGSCGDMEEIFCTVNPLACDGYMVITSLSPGQPYFVRISSVALSNGAFTTGNTCISIRDGGQMPDIQPLQLQADYTCYGNGTALLQIVTTGGDGNYFLSGNANQSLLNDGDAYLVVAQDGRGCERSISGQVDCTATGACNLQLSANLLQTPSCFNTADGVATVTAMNGDENYTYAWPNGQSTATASNLAAGSYVVTVTDGANCAGVVVVNVPAGTPIVLTIQTVIPATNGANGAIQFDYSGGTGDLQVTWYRDGALLTEVNPQALLPGEYEIAIMDAQGCTFRSAPIVVPNITAADEAPAADYFVAAAPNPTTGILQLTWDLPASTTLAVFDAKGRRVRQFSRLAASMYRYTVDLTPLPNGLYLLYWEADGRTWTQRAVKQ